MRNGSFVRWILVAVLEVIVFPNPARVLHGQGEITFGQLTPGAEIKIFTADGNLVREIHTGSEPDFHWNIKNDSGKDVASGMYVYSVNDSGGTVTGKIAVIRQ